MPKRIFRIAHKAFETLARLQIRLQAEAIVEEVCEPRQYGANAFLLASVTADSLESIMTRRFVDPSGLTLTMHTNRLRIGWPPTLATSASRVFKASSHNRVLQHAAG